MRIVAQVATWLFMPILMPIYALLLVMYVPSEAINISEGNSLYNLIDQFKLIFLACYFVFIVVAPAIMYFFMRENKIIKTVQLDDKKERNFPLINMTIFCFILFFLLVKISGNAHLPKYLYGLTLSGGVIVGIFIYVNRFIKVSLHATGVGILTGFVFAYACDQVYFTIVALIAVILVSGFVLSARLYLEKHSPKELIIGYFFSLFITFVINYFYPF